MYALKQYRLCLSDLELSVLCISLSLTQPQRYNGLKQAKNKLSDKQNAEGVVVYRLTHKTGVRRKNDLLNMFRPEGTEGKFECDEG